MMSGQSDDTDFKALLGAELHGLRRAAGLDRAAAAEALGCSIGKIGTVERGDTALSQAEVDALLTLYGVQAPRDRGDLHALAREARKRRKRTSWGSAVPERLKRYLRLEDRAREIRNYNPELVHGLAQTEGYARALISTTQTLSSRDVDHLVAARLARQARLSGPRAIRMSLVLPEGALRLPIGGSDVMREQLQHLITLGERPNIEIRVLPNSAGAHPSRGFPFSIIESGVPRKTVVYLENPTDGIVVDDEERTARYVAAWPELLRATLSVEDTARTLARVAAEL